MLEILSIIPARSGSKGFPDKNIFRIGEKHLLGYSVEASLKCKFISRTVVSTDSAHYAQIASGYGAEVPFLRPAEIAGDESLDIEFLQHGLDFLSKKENYKPDYVVLLRPTTPYRPPQLMNQIFEEFLRISKDQELTSFITIVKSPVNPYKLWEKRGRLLKGLMSDERFKEPHSLPRQKLPITWMNAGVADIISAETINKGSTLGEHVGYFELPTHLYNDIDSEEDVFQVQRLLGLGV
jgi:CMP-N,N'-diacetyllegionaminic acid synthase